MVDELSLIQLLPFCSFKRRFGIYDPSRGTAEADQYYLSNVRSGLIVGLLSIGTLGASLASFVLERALN